jgi:putative phage-type endonuclease
MKTLILKTEEEWLEARKGVITATEATCILGLNKYLSANQMYLNKIGKGEPFKGNSYSRVGQLLESTVVDATNKAIPNKDFSLFEDSTGAKTFCIDSSGLIGATPDAYSPSGALLECKTTSRHNYMKWAYSPPVGYLAQLATQLSVMERSTGYLSIMCTDMSPSHFSDPLKLAVFKLTLPDSRYYDILLKEVERFNRTVRENKLFRAGNKKHRLDFYLKFNTVRIV